MNSVTLTSTTAINADGYTPTANELKVFLTRSRRVISKLTQYQDKATLATLSDQKERLEAMLAAAKKDESKRAAIDSEYCTVGHTL